MKIFSRRAWLLGLVILFQGQYSLTEEQLSNNEGEEQNSSYALVHRGMLSVPSTISPSYDAISIESVTTAYLGTTTKNFCKAKLYKFLKSVYYTPSVSGDAAVRVTASGATVDFFHNAFCFCNKGCSVTDTRGIGFEIGYSPAAREADATLEQPDSVTIENGLMCGWDIAIMVHSGVKNLIIRNMVFTGNVIPIAVIGKNSDCNVIEDGICNVTLENVSIIGDGDDKKACLSWIRSKISDGSDLGFGTTSMSPYGYNNGEVMPNDHDAIADIHDQAEVYTGVYFYGTTDIKLKKVHVSNIGCSKNIGGGTNPAILSERTSAYGLWFRNSSTIFMDEVTSIKNSSSNSVVGAMFENSSLISGQNCKFSDNEIIQQQPVGAKVNVPEGLWAAGIVLKNASTVELSDIVLSENRGIDTVWGLRVFNSARFNNVASSIRPTIDEYVSVAESIGLQNIWADGLRADSVYGLDFGDLRRKLITNFDTVHPDSVTELLPAGSVEKLRLENVYVRSAAGKVVDCNIESEVLKEFKGIYLGDGSRNITIDGAFIESNNVVLDKTGLSDVGVNSGIEFGANSKTYKFAPLASGTNNDLADFSAKALVATGKAKGTLYDTLMNNLQIGSNTGGSGDFRFVGIRAVATGTTADHSKGLNTFSGLTISNSTISNNQFDGIRMVDDIDGDSEITVSSLTMKNLSSKNSIDGYGAHFEKLIASKGVDCQFDYNKERGFYSTFIDNFDGQNIVANGTSEKVVNLLPGQTVAAVYGFDAGYGSRGITIDGGSFSSTTAVDADVAGFHVEYGDSIVLKCLKASYNSSSLGSKVGPFTTRGIYLEGSVDHIGFSNVEVNSNEALNGDVYGLQIDRATAIHMDEVSANNNKAEGSQSTNKNVSQSTGMYFKATVGSKNSEGCLLSNLHASGNNSAYITYGIHMESPIGLQMKNVDASSNISDATGKIDSLPVLCQATGLYLDGGCSVHIENLTTSANHEVEVEGANLSRYLQKGTSPLDSEANKNLSAEIARHFSVANQAGAYGVFVKGTRDLAIDGGNACKNNGVRAYGIHGRYADNMSITNFETFDNHGIGGVWFDEVDPFAGMDNEAVNVPDAQAACFFGGVNPSHVINLKLAYKTMLSSISALRQSNSSSSGSSEGDCDDPCASSSIPIITGSSQKKVSGYFNIIWAAIAQVRRFCVGTGIGLYNCDFANIDKCKSIGNHSDFDSAGGFVLYGSGEGDIVSNSVAANNECWKNSERGGKDSFIIDGDIDISRWIKFYNFLDVRMLKKETAGAQSSSNVFELESLPLSINLSQHIDNGDRYPTGTINRKPSTMQFPYGATTGIWLLDSRRLTIGLATGLAVEQSLYDFLAVGPIGVGILSDSQRDAQVSENNAYGNKGHGAMGFGIFSDSASSSIYLDNKATSNAADAAGYAWGLADFTMSTPNIWYKNWMFANRVDEFMNSSYYIQFSASGQSLPVQTIYPGSTETLINALPFDNIVVKFNNERQRYDCVGDLIVDNWLSEHIIL